MSNMYFFQIFISFLGKVLLVPKVAFAKVEHGRTEVTGSGELDEEKESPVGSTAVNEWYRIALALDRFALLLFGLLIIGIFVTFSIGLSESEHHEH